MTLKKWLKTANLTVSAFGRLAGIPHQTVFRYLSGRIPEPKEMRLILKATRGQVTPNDFYGVRR